MAIQKQTLFLNAHIVGRPKKLYAVLITDGVIGKIVEGEGLPDELWGGVEVVDCKQADGTSLWISPGMIDWHTHQKLNAVASHRLHLQSATSAQMALDMVASALKDPKYDPKLELNLVGVNMRNGFWPDAHLMCREELDKLSSDRPIYLMWNGYHSMCVNSIGLEKAGVSVVEYPDGILVEKDAFRVSHDLSNVGEDVLDQWIFDEAKYAASLGVVDIVDLEMTHNIAHWQRRCAKGFNTLRVHIGFYDEHLSDAISLGLKTGDPVPGCNGTIITGPYKIVTDGSLGSQTAFCHDVYPDTDNHGIFVYPKRTLAEMIARGTEHDFRMAVHAIGDHANHLTLKTISEGPKLREGSTIEHAQLLNFDDLPLFASLGLIASIQPCHLVDDRQLCHKFWPGREGRAYPFKSIVDAGIPIKLGSDAPIAPLHPWEAIAVAITRAGEHESSPFCAEQIIDIGTAFKASTCNGKAHIVESEKADLCLLSSNPLECDAKGLRAMRCVGTLLQGNWTHRQLPSKMTSA